MSEFSKGEWIFNEGHIKVRNDQKYGAAEGKYPFTPTIARMDYPSMVGASVIPEDEQKANVSLVLAAPELYEALEECYLALLAEINLDDSEVVTPSNHYMGKAKAALAKARGEA